MSKPGRAAEYTAPTAEATPLQDVPPIPEPTGSASRDGAVTAPPANLDGASPAATAPEAPVSPIPTPANCVYVTFVDAECERAIVSVAALDGVPVEWIRKAANLKIPGLRYAALVAAFEMVIDGEA